MGWDWSVDSCVQTGWSYYLECKSLRLLCALVEFFPLNVRFGSESKSVVCNLEGISFGWGLLHFEVRLVVCFVTQMTMLVGFVDENAISIIFKWYCNGTGEGVESSLIYRACLKVVIWLYLWNSSSGSVWEDVTMCRSWITEMGLIFSCLRASLNSEGRSVY
mgnify:CR=1 FL=1